MIEDDKPSKTRRKREVHALQALGEALVELNEAQLAAVEMPERLRDAVMAARRITRHEARRRQLQYIGKLMRGVDADPIRAAIDACRSRAREQTVLHKRAEAWRERLIADPAAADALLAEYPAADAQTMQALAHSALREREAGQPPRAFRQLYQALRSLMEEERDR